MKIEVLRIGTRLVRDDRVTTHVTLVSRAFGASKIYMYDANPEKIPMQFGGRDQFGTVDFFLIRFTL